MNTHDIDTTLAEVESAIKLLNGPGFQTEIKAALPPFGLQEAR